MNAISVDLEDWWCNEYLRPHLGNEDQLICEDQLYESVGPILELFDEREVNATFFVLGSTAVRYPDLIKDIHDRGHEIACHGYSHIPLTRLTKDDLKKELDESLKLIGRYSPRGYRAPSFSLNNSTNWAIDVISESGFVYDSSIFPTWTPLYSSFRAPKSIYNISSTDVEAHDSYGDLVEVPLTVTASPLFGFPCAGGFYLRIIPEKMLINALLKVQRSRPVVLYAHPWETNPDIPRVDAGIIGNFEANYGKASVMRKLGALLNRMEFGPVIDLVKEYREKEGRNIQP